MAMATNPTSLRERILAEELARIRSTYSFQLGLLITESFVRKPWKIPLFPFSFIALNLQFLKKRKQSHDGNSKPTQGLDRDCVFLISTSEEGISSAERSAELAHKLTKDGKKVVIMSTFDSITDMLPRAAINFPISDPKKRRKEQRSQWNAQCENLISNILDTHRPHQVIFDGPYPYRGILNVTKYYAFTEWIWLRPTGVESETMMVRGKPFDRIVTFRLDELEQVVDKKSQVRSPNSPSILIAPNYESRRPLSNKILDLIGSNDRLRNWDVVCPQNTEHNGHALLSGAVFINRVLDGDLLGTLDAAIVSPNIELVTKLVSHGIPTLCIYNDADEGTALRLLNARFPNLPILFAQRNDLVQLELSINTLVTENSTIRKHASILASVNLDDLISAQIAS